MAARKKSRFSIWNVLGSVFLIVVLYVVFFPATCGCNSVKAKQASCESNMRQLAVGILEYAQDNDQRFPSGEPNIKRGHRQLPGLGWASQIYPYEKSTGVYMCPSSNRPYSGGPGISYCYNVNLAAGRQNSLSNSTKTVLLYETEFSPVNPSLPNEAESASPPSHSPAADGTDYGLMIVDGTSIHNATGPIGSRPRYFPKSAYLYPEGLHTNGANYLMASGIVRWLDSSQVSSGGNAISINDSQTGSMVGNAAGTSDPSHEATFSTR